MNYQDVLGIVEVDDKTEIYVFEKKRSRKINKEKIISKLKKSIKLKIRELIETRNYIITFKECGGIELEKHIDNCYEIAKEIKSIIEEILLKGGNLDFLDMLNIEKDDKLLAEGIKIYLKERKKKVK